VTSDDYEGRHKAEGDLVTKLASREIVELDLYKFMAVGGTKLR
jgi:hypothetical protein